MKPAQRFDLDGRVALVTGGSGGLGAQFARALADAGATVVVAARRMDRLEAVAAEHPRIEAIRCDVADSDSLDETVETILARHGTIDVLVNNAGTSLPHPAEAEPIDDFRAVLEVNLVAAFHLCRLVGSGMLERGRGSIVNIASIFGIVAMAPLRNASYASSKGALVHLTRELAVQWADRGVRVNALAPGFFPTAMSNVVSSDERSMRYVLRNTPMHRVGLAGELDGALLLLASDAGSFISGQVIVVDGGWTAR